MFRLAFIAIAAMVSLSSCKKDDAKEKADLLTAGNWTRVSEQLRIGTGQWVERISNYPACELDNYWTFKADHTAELNDGATKCGAGEQSRSFRWMFANGETELHFDGTEFTLDELSASTLMITYSTSDAGVTTYMKVTFKH